MYFVWGFILSTVLCAGGEPAPPSLEQSFAAPPDAVARELTKIRAKDVEMGSNR